jgi:hypothetical protein
VAEIINSTAGICLFNTEIIQISVKISEPRSFTKEFHSLFHYNEALTDKALWRKVKKRELLELTRSHSHSRSFLCGPSWDDYEKVKP